LWLLLPYNFAEKTVIISITSPANSCSKDFVVSFNIIVSTPKCLAILISRSLPNLSSLSLCVKIILLILFVSISFSNLFSPFFLKFNPLPISLIYSMFSSLFSSVIVRVLLFVFLNLLFGRVY